jgi:ATP-binding cassette subfamily B protein
MHISFRQYKDLLVTYLRPHLVKVGLLMLLLLGNIGLELANPQILRYYIDTTQGSGALTTLLGAALIFLVVVFATQIVGSMATYIGEDVGWQATNRLRSDLALHCLRLDMSFHKKHTAGEMIARIDGDVSVLANFFSQFIMIVVGNLLLLIGVLVLVALADWRIGIVLALYAVIALLVLRRVQGIAVPAFKAYRQAVAEISSFWEERLTGTEDIRANGAVAYVARRHVQFLRLLKAKGQVSQLVSRTFQSVLEFFSSVGLATAFAFGAYLLHAGAISIGTLYLIYAYTNMLSTYLGQLTEQINDLQSATAGIERIRELYYTTSEIENSDRDGVSSFVEKQVGHSRGVGLPRPLEKPRTVRAGQAHAPTVSESGGNAHILDGALAVEFQHVSFGYTEDRHVLHGISLQIKPNSILGILGRTGSGKTTLTRLLFRFYEPATGSIRLGNTDIRAVPLKELREHIGIVTQEVQLFQASVRNNLTFFDKHTSDERILAAIEDLGLAAWYAGLPNGLDTELVAGGGGLSAGEAQLLALTRVFLKNPGLIILDEASSRLDPATERLLERAMSRLLHNRTGIVIAHRLATVRHTDEILILEDGRIKELGKREQLARDSDSYFYHLLQTGIEGLLA